VALGAAILAGGRARRYGGRDKGALVVDGRSIRDRQIAELAVIADDIMIVGWSGDLRQGSGEGRTKVRTVPDRMPGAGPLGGVHTALIESPFPTVVVVACDMPYISAHLLRYFAQLADGADVVVPRSEAGYHPLCAAYTRACLEPAARRLAAGQLKMIDLFEDVRVRVVGPNELQAFGDVRRMLANVNSPADFHELEALQGHQPSS
jgi:molybdenum cofactor guanylyltransferase